MERASPENPNVCSGCAQLLEDSSPVQAAFVLDDAPDPRETTQQFQHLTPSSRGDDVGATG